MAGKKNHKSLNIAGIDPARRAALEAERDARRKAQASTPPKPRRVPAGKPFPAVPAVPSYEAPLPLPPAISPRRSSSDAEPLALPPLITGEEGIGDGFVLMRTKIAPAAKAAPKTMMPTEQPCYAPPARTRLPVMSEAAALAGGLFSGGVFGIPSTFFTLEGAAMRSPRTPNRLGAWEFGALSTVSFTPFDTAAHRSLPPLQRCASTVLFRGAAPAERVARSFSAPPSFVFTDNPIMFARTLPSPLPPPPHGACNTPALAQAAAAVDEQPSHPISRVPSSPLSFDDGTPQADASAEPKAGAPSPKRRLRSLTSALGAAAKLLAPRKARGQGGDTSDGGAAMAAVVAAEPACPGSEGGKRKGRGAAAAIFKRFMGCCSTPRVNKF
ncbi:hypothetical protein Rsub_08980 [Raphidocelis subcapitata]|uniref:Uncharacterized protein n=1 Tax=Raphidocelis subcapitata TaxID=307507 RepID=A0A2V0P8B5_9CHLO|nr:hypothetical protein Rsub_08980 [Raphidocelis subcapitata]|eukprot:GBF96104.1 hypothetical protein Rsub_08980 [Raphidocelis subcapitata]